MEETLISFETAKLAKDKGFDWEVILYYINSGELCPKEEIEYCIKKGSFLNNNFNEFGEDYYSFKDVLEEHISAPTQSLLQKWLRDIHQFRLFVSPKDITPREGYIYHIIKDKQNLTFDNVKLNGGLLQGEGITFNTYEEALEVGLKEALNLIK